MVDSEVYLRLRLAARTLIELNTPATSPEYRRVLTDLLSVHPYAASWGLTPDKELLKLDERGAILWYLTETVNATKVPTLEVSPRYMKSLKGHFGSRPEVPEYVYWLEQYSLSALTEYIVVGSADE